MKKGKNKKHFVDFDIISQSLNTNLLNKGLSPTLEQGSKKLKGKAPKNKEENNLNQYASFKMDYGDNPFLSSDDEIKETKKDNPQLSNMPKFEQIKGKSEYEYQSVFQLGTKVANSENEYDNEFLDGFMIKEYFDIVQKNFPEMTKEEITKKILLYNFDIDKLLSDLYSEKEFPFLSKESKEKYINQNIKTDEEIDADFSKLQKIFPLVDIEQITSLYLSNDLDYLKTRNYIINNKIAIAVKEENSNNKGKNAGKEKEKIIYNKKEYKEEKGNEWIEEISDFFEKGEITKKKIVPAQLNINAYKATLLQYYNYANLSFSQGRQNEAKNILQKAKEYKLKTEEKIKQNKISIFISNNIKYDKYDNIIDLHGMNVAEGKIIIQKKLMNCKGTLTVITGKGIHSENKKAVLYPELLKFIKNDLKRKCKGEIDLGQIIIF